MTEERLKQYQAAIKERNLWAKKIAQLECKDVRSAARDSHYRGCAVWRGDTGRQEENRKVYRKRYEKWLAEAERLRDEIDDFIDSIEDSQIRQIVEHRFKDGLTWSRVADEIGGNNTEGSAKQAFYRFMKICSICSDIPC